MGSQAAAHEAALVAKDRYFKQAYNLINDWEH
jgi:hypothetical protein